VIRNKEKFEVIEDKDDKEQEKEKLKIVYY